MVLEQEILPYPQWLAAALPMYLLVGFALLVLGVALGYVIAASRHGLLRGGDRVYQTVAGGLREISQFSFRRVWALAWLAMKEALRRRVWVALVVFLLILLFASWFLKPDNPDPAKLYISFVLTATTYLMLGIALLISSFSLPNDFKTKTIYTIVTKPVRSGEIVLGRIVGFTLLGTAMLVLMGLASYVFVTRSLSHTHEIDEVKGLKRILDSSDEVIAYDGRTTNELFHRHTVELDADRNGEALAANGHWHTVTADGDQIRIGPAEGILKARRPVYGKLRFLDRQGVEKAHGVNVGNEWTYRSFIEGNTQAAAIWTFRGITGANLVENDAGAELLPIGRIVRVFKTHKGTIGQAISGGMQVRNPDTGLTSQVVPFDALDAQVDEVGIPRKLVSTDGDEIDLLDDIVTDSGGRMEIIIQCLERGQYFGFAQPDCYLRLPDGSPEWNLVKVYFSIWVQMVIVIAIGVAASTLLSGPVAMLFTVSFILLGFKKVFFEEIATGPKYGGGPLESAYRLVTQMNMISNLDEGMGTAIIKSVDAVLEFFMWCLCQVLPEFASFSTVGFAAYGFDVPMDRVLQDLTICLGYVAGLAVVGYFLLRTREVAR